MGWLTECSLLRNGSVWAFLACFALRPRTPCPSHACVPQLGGAGALVHAFCASVPAHHAHYHDHGQYDKHARHHDHGASIHAKGVCLYVPHLLVRWHSVKLTFAKTKFLVASSSQQRALLDVYHLPWNVATFRKIMFFTSYTEPSADSEFLHLHRISEFFRFI